MLEMRIVVEATGAGATFLLSPVWIWIKCTLHFN
jgi:hypothetical protein